MFDILQVVTDAPYQASCGLIHIIFVVDPLNSTPETDETNNQAATAHPALACNGRKCTSHCVVSQC